MSTSCKKTSTAAPSPKSIAANTNDKEKKVVKYDNAYVAVNYSLEEKKPFCFAPNDKPKENKFGKEFKKRTTIPTKDNNIQCEPRTLYALIIRNKLDREESNFYAICDSQIEAENKIEDALRDFYDMADVDDISDVETEEYDHILRVILPIENCTVPSGEPIVLFVAASNDYLLKDKLLDWKPRSAFKTDDAVDEHLTVCKKTYTFSNVFSETISFICGTTS